MVEVQLESTPFLFIFSFNLLHSCWPNANITVHCGWVSICWWKLFLQHEVFWKHRPVSNLLLELSRVETGERNSGREFSIQVFFSFVLSYQLSVGGSFCQLHTASGKELLMSFSPSCFFAELLLFHSSSALQFLPFCVFMLIMLPSDLPIPRAPG